MKKLFLIGLVALGFTVNSNAQDVDFGAKAGLNFATINGDETDRTNMKTAFHLGGYAEIMLSDDFSVQPELLYSMQGTKIDDSYTELGVSVKEETDIKIDYINIPIMAKYYVSEGLSLEAGPQFGFLISAEADSDVTVGGQTQSATIDLKDNLKSLDFGFNVGIGYKLDTGINFGARYNLGLSNVNDNDQEGLKNQNGVVQLSVGYTF